MQEYFKHIEIRWSDLDPNFHVLHSKYYDFGAYCRMSFLTENGMTAAKMQQYHIGPIIFREECIFKKEIKFGDIIKVTLRLDSVTDHYRKWTMSHELFINDDTLAALITVDGAWMDTQLRKTAVPPAEFAQAFDQIPHTPGFKQSA